MQYLYKIKVIQAITILTGGYLLYYLWWRASSTLNYSELAFSLLLLVAEILGVANFFLFALMTFKIKKEDPGSPIPNVKVDVFIPTYNEDLEILEATLTGCININYPHTTYMLDDGKRPEVATLASRLGCQYLTRADNKHAKAGNINAALLKTDGEFIVIVDADTVPQPDYLEKTLGYFRDDRVAIVQLPQEFYNADSIQHQIAGAWHEQALFFRVIQPGKNRLNAAFWCGSPSIVRRRALEEIGGVATETITEDLHTSIRLNSKGWKIKYHDEALAFGIAPQSFHAFSVQRLRWAQGAMQILRSKENPLIAPGLSLKQRLSHFSAIFTYFDSYQKLFYFITPIIILLTGILPIRVSGLEFLMHWLPFILLSSLANIALGRGYFRYIDTERYNMLKMFTFIKSSIYLLWPRNLTFLVTPKKVDESINRKDRRELLLHIILMGIIFLSIAIGILNLIWKSSFYHTAISNIFVAIFWSMFNIVLLGVTVVYIINRLYFRQEYRFPVQKNLQIQVKNVGWVPTKTVDISRQGVGTIIPDIYQFDDKISVMLELPDGPLEAKCDLVYTGLQPSGFRKLGLKFQPFAQRDQSRLLFFLYVYLPRETFNKQQMDYKNNLLFIKTIMIAK